MNAAIVRIVSAGVPLVRDDINTDVIIPSREMKSVSRDGLADGLFADWRYHQVGGRDPVREFVLNDPAYATASILVTGANFGCGSSREHAAWALREYGFRAVIAKSFNPIFRANAALNGIVPVIAPPAAVDAIASVASATPRAAITIDLDSMRVTMAKQITFPFELGNDARAMLRDGLDLIDLTLQRVAQIERFRLADRLLRPWAY